MWQLILRGFVAGAIVMAVISVSNRSPKLGAFLLTLPVVSIIAFFMAWYTKKDLDGISKMARQTLVLVPLGLPFFVPLAFAQKFGGFWWAFICGLAAAAVTVGLWLWLGPKSL
ncbi:MAG: hypothetical protein JWL69_1723 [Phycisphaerales bacterium]|nr:hypothetical protein [Phycisphaerales bacterium]MDB5355735.1 hypothetical protein [Phycisphaerales bacterium]